MYPFEIDSLNSFSHILNTNIFKYIFIYTYIERKREI